MPWAGHQAFRLSAFSWRCDHPPTRRERHLTVASCSTTVVEVRSIPARLVMSQKRDLTGPRTMATPGAGLGDCRSRLRGFRELGSSCAPNTSR